MSNMFRGKPHFQFCQSIDAPAVRNNLKATEWRLMEYLYFVAQRQNKMHIELTNSQLCAELALDYKSLRSAREGLEQYELIRLQRITDSIYVYILCSFGVPLEADWDRSGRTYGKRTVPFNQRTPEEYTKYYESRLGCSLRRDDGSPKTQANVRCTLPNHPDEKPSFSLCPTTGQFKCHGCGIEGAMVAFEMKYSKCDKATAGRNITAILEGRSPAAPEPEVLETYPYYDSSGYEAFQIRRYPDNDFKAWHLKGGVYTKGKGSRWKGIIYNMPAVIASTTCAVTEGEKDSNTVNALCLNTLDGMAVPATTNPFGALKWSDDHSPWFAHKRVIIMADADDKGRIHAERVGASIRRFTKDIVTITAWDGAGDVTDWMANHTREQLISKVDRDTGTSWLQHDSLQQTLEA